MRVANQAAQRATVARWLRWFEFVTTLPEPFGSLRTMPLTATESLEEMANNGDTLGNVRPTKTRLLPQPYWPLVPNTSVLAAGS